MALSPFKKAVVNEKVAAGVQLVNEAVPKKGMESKKTIGEQKFKARRPVSRHYWSDANTKKTLGNNQRRTKRGERKDGKNGQVLNRKQERKRNADLYPGIIAAKRMIESKNTIQGQDAEEEGA